MHICNMIISNMLYTNVNEFNFNNRERNHNFGSHLKLKSFNSTDTKLYSFYLLLIFFSGPLYFNGDGYNLYFSISWRLSFIPAVKYLRQIVDLNKNMQEIRMKVELITLTIMVYFNVFIVLCKSYILTRYPCWHPG